VSRPRVLYVILEPEWSGAESVHVPVLRDDPDPLMACPPGSATERWARGLGVPTVGLAYRRMRISQGPVEALRGVFRAVVVARDLRRIMRRHPERTLVFGTSIRPSIVASLAALGLRGRRVVWTVADLLPEGLAGTAVRAVARLTRARLLCTSRYIERQARIPGAIAAWPGVEVLPALESVPRQASTALLVGHISPTKRTDLAVDIAVRVGADVADFRLDIVGQAQYRDEDHALEAALRARAQHEEDVARHVAFVGHDPDVRARMARVGLLLHCRPDEPFGMVMIEAMAAGLPVVAPASGGPLEIVADGETGLLYPPGDADAAAAAVVRLVRDPELARAMGEAGRERVRTHFAAERQVREWVAFQAAAAQTVS